MIQAVLARIAYKSQRLLQSHVSELNLAAGNRNISGRTWKYKFISALRGGSSSTSINKYTNTKAQQSRQIY
jgi:hypothetical protein